MTTLRLKGLASALVLVLTVAGTSLSEAESAAGREAVLTSSDVPFQIGRSFSVTWGGATDSGSGLASYSVSVRSAPFNGLFGPWEPFQTDVMPVPADPVIAAAGDIACGADTSPTADCVEMQTSDLLVQMNPDVVVPLGDVQYEKGQYEYFLTGRGPGTNTGYDLTWGRLKARTRPAVGNHEFHDPAGAFKGYYDYFNGIDVFSGPAGDRDKGYYSFNLGRWHLIALNSNCMAVGGCHAGSLQHQWLLADLAANPRSCTLAYIHQPRWSSENRSGADHIAIQALVQALYDGGVELLLTGHSHNYERFAPQTPSQQLDPAAGIRQIIVGTGGRDVSANYTTPLETNSEVRDGNTFGVLKVTLHSKSYEWQFVPIIGQSFTDSGSSPCHGLINDTTPPTVPVIGGAAPTGSAVFVGEPGYTYCFRATATDFDGNTSEPSGELCTSIPIDNISFKHRGGWVKKWGVGHYLETFSVTKRRGATMILKNVHAKHLAIIVTKCKRCGVIDVFFQGKLLRRIRLRSSMTKKLRMIDLQTFDSVQVGSVKIRVVSDGKLVRVDGLGVSSA
jgi:hypothetical protein